jgi:hypothetical protein
MSSQMAYSDEEWGLLVGLPQAVMIAAISAEDDGSRRSQAESAAGLDAISAGRDSGSALVQDVATELVDRLGEPEPGEAATVVDLAGRAGTSDVLDRAREVAALLSAKAGPGEAAAYKHWLKGIAEQVVNAAKSGGFLGIGGEWVSEAEQHFVDELKVILGV